MKKYLSILLAIMMLAAMFSGCGGAPAEDTQGTTPATVPTEPETVHPTDPMEMITDGYYTYGYTAEGYGDFTYFFHFYEEDPVLGAVFYAGLLNNGVLFAGTYTVEKKDCDYACYIDRDEATKEDGVLTTGTAPYTVSFYDWAGNLIDACAYDGDILYNDLETISAMASGPVFYHHDIDGSDSKYAEIYAGEMGVAYLEFVGAEDDLATLSLSHNGTYVDLVGMIVEGTWTIAPNEEGGYDYTLTTNSGEEDAVISVSADTRTAVYKKLDGSLTIDMVNAVAETVEETGRYVGTCPTDYGEDATITLVCYVDGTAAVTMEIYGNTGDVDNGTYTAGEDGTITFTFEGAGEIVSDGKTVHYVNEAAAIDAELSKEGASEFLVLAGEGGMAAYEGFTFPENLTFYDDGTCALSVEIQGEVTVLAEGTYTANDYGIPESVTLEGFDELPVTMDYTTMLLSVEIPAIEEAGFNAATLSLTLGG